MNTTHPTPAERVRDALSRMSGPFTCVDLCRAVQATGYVSRSAVRAELLRQYCMGAFTRDPKKTRDGFVYRRANARVEDKMRKLDCVVLTIRGATAAIPLTRGKWAYIDVADVPLVAGRKWRARHDFRGHTEYADYHYCRNGKRTWVLMHRLIANAPEGKMVDHRDGNGLNNRRSNLRLCTARQNRANSKNRRKTGNYRGVSPRGCGRWRARINGGGAPKHLGTFATAEDAARAYDSAALNRYGEFAVTNFSDVEVGHE